MIGLSMLYTLINAVLITAFVFNGAYEGNVNPNDMKTASFVNWWAVFAIAIPWVLNRFFESKYPSEEVPTGFNVRRLLERERRLESIESDLQNGRVENELPCFFNDLGYRMEYDHLIENNIVGHRI